MTPLKKIAKEIVRFKKSSGKNIVCCWMSNQAKSILEKNNIPCFFEPKRVAEFLGN